MKKYLVLLSVVFSLLVVGIVAAQATVLEFQNAIWPYTGIVDNVNPGYGDNVSPTSPNFASFGTYGEGNGWTPDITVSYQYQFSPISITNPISMNNGLRLDGGSLTG